jgi:Uma2 family endonuclease
LFLVWSCFLPQADIAVLDAMADYGSYSSKFYFVAEVLSDSSTDKDIAVKRQRYLQHPDNLYFVLIEQKRVRAEVLALSASWKPLVLEGLDASLELPDWDFRTPLSELYRGTPLERAASS